MDIRQQAWGVTPNDEPELHGDAAILQARIKTALDRLSAKERTVFVMKLYNGFKIKEIAEILDVTAGTVKSLLFRAVKKLQKELVGYSKSLRLGGVAHE